MTANNQMRVFGYSLVVWSTLPWRNFVLPHSVLLALCVFSQPSTFYAQPAPNRVLELDGNGSYVELPPNIFKDLEQVTVEGWVRWDSIDEWCESVPSFDLLNLSVQTNLRP